jgi:hypothetical protein
MPSIPNRDTIDQTFANLTLAASYVGPWLRREGFNQVACEWVSTGGATLTVTVEESLDGVTADRSTSAGAAGAAGPAAPVNVPVAAPWVRMKIVDSVAGTATLRAAMSATG